MHFPRSTRVDQQLRYLYPNIPCATMSDRSQFQFIVYSLLLAAQPPRTLGK